MLIWESQFYIHVHVFLFSNLVVFLGKKSLCQFSYPLPRVNIFLMRIYIDGNTVKYNLLKLHSSDICLINIRLRTSLINDKFKPVSIFVIMSHLLIYYVHTIL